MADATDKEPTMEEILASIRRIISEEAEDERARETTEPAENEPAAEAPPEVEEDEPAEEPMDPQAAADALFADEEPGEDDAAASQSEPEEDDRAAEDAAADEEEAEADDVFDLTEPADEEPADDFAAALAAADEQVAEAEEPAAPQPEEEAIVSPPTEVKVAASFAELSAMLIKSADGGAPTLEGLVREMLKPMMRAWLDENLPRIVEDMVAQEIARLSARSRRR